MSVMGADPLSQSGLEEEASASARRRRISWSSASRFCFSRAVASRREEVEFVRKERSLFAIFVCCVVLCCCVGGECIDGGVGSGEWGLALRARESVKFEK